MFIENKFNLLLQSLPLSQGKIYFLNINFFSSTVSIFTWSVLFGCNYSKASPPPLLKALHLHSYYSHSKRIRQFKLPLKCLLEIFQLLKKSWSHQRKFTLTMDKAIQQKEIAIDFMSKIDAKFQWLFTQNFSQIKAHVPHFLQVIWSVHAKILINIILDTVNDQLSALGAYLKVKKYLFHTATKSAWQVNFSQNKTPSKIYHKNPFLFAQIGS